MTRGVWRARGGAVLCAILAGAAAAGAQVGRLSGPVVGYVWDAEHRDVRPVSGILGSAVLGGPLPLGLQAAHALVLTDRHLLVWPDAGRAPLVVDAGAGPPRLTPAPGPSTPPARSAASRLGSAAAVYDNGAARIAILTGLPGAPVLSAAVDVRHLGAPIAHLAIADDGQTLLYAAGASVYRWTRATGPRFLLALEAVGGLALSAAGDAVVAIPSRDEVVFVPRSGSGWRVLAHAGQGLARPVGVAVAADGRIHVANAGSGALMTFGPDGALLGSVPCACEIAGVSPMREAVYRLTDRTDRTLYLLDDRNRAPRIVFVPPGPAHD